MGNSVGRSSRTGTESSAGKERPAGWHVSDGRATPDIRAVPGMTSLLAGANNLPLSRRQLRARGSPIHEPPLSTPPPPPAELPHHPSTVTPSRFRTDQPVPSSTPIGTVSLPPPLHTFDSPLALYVTLSRRFGHLTLTLSLFLSVSLLPR